MMANAYCTRGHEPLVVPANFKSALYIGDREEVNYLGIESTLQDPLSGNLTNKNDMSIIRGLRNVAMNSKTFTCYRNCINNMTGDVTMCVVWSLCCFCQCFGTIPLIFKRNVQPSKSTLKRIESKQIKF